MRKQLLLPVALNLLICSSFHVGADPVSQNESDAARLAKHRKSSTGVGTAATTNVQGSSNEAKIQRGGQQDRSLRHDPKAKSAQTHRSVHRAHIGDGKKRKNKRQANEPRSPQPSAAILSDVRAKTDICFVGWSAMGIPIYRFSYLSEPDKRYQGTIAQVLTRIRPDAVIRRDGVLFVDYSQLDVTMEEVPQAAGWGTLTDRR